jgi:hypothetical protein
MILVDNLLLQEKVMIVSVNIHVYVRAIFAFPSYLYIVFYILCGINSKQWYLKKIKGGGGVYFLTAEVLTLTQVCHHINSSINRSQFSIKIQIGFGNGSIKISFQRILNDQPSI